MKTFSFTQLVLLAFVLLFAASACTDSVNNVDEVEASEEDVTALQNVVGDGLSDQNEGLISTIHDLTAQMHQEGGLQYPFRNNQDWRGPFNNFNYSYDPETGIHLI